MPSQTARPLGRANCPPRPQRPEGSIASSFFFPTATTAHARPAVAAARAAAAALQDASFVVPDWLALADGSALEEHPREWGDMAKGWQRAACTVMDHRALETLFRELDPASRALMLSQAGRATPYAH